MSTPVRATLDPSTRVQFLAGVGPARARLFEKLGITTLEQLVRHYPRAYLDARTFVTVRELRSDKVLTVLGKVRSAATHRTRGGRTDFTARVADHTGVVTCHFFGQPWLARALAPGASVVVSGTIDRAGRMSSPLFEVVESETEELLHAGRWVPVHALTRGLTARGMRAAVRRALDAIADRVVDPLPREAAGELEPLHSALRHIHFPDDERELERARERLAFEELFLALPFVLTADQEGALAEIVRDLASPRPMHRLLVGDVGSGKTVVALLAALHVIESGLQAAFMVPTEILARQHALTLTRFARATGVEVVALTGASSPGERRVIQGRLAAGEPLLLVGTHALLEAKVGIPKLGVAIVDEQHRFGVRQRATLAHKGIIPDVLVLSATPIPRTLALAMYGDLDVSQIRNKPPGRGRVVTRVAGEEKFPQVVEFMAQELDAGRQAYVVLPVIEDGGRIDARAAAAEHERLAQHPLLSRWNVGLLHGRLKADEKQRVMDGFVAGRIQVLVTTTVIEVGVDVSNATLMVIENAERFGLSQLHQLRGRVGRGTHRSVCVLVPGLSASGEATARLNELTATEDGFALAEADLRLRGPGELWGTRQSGLPRLKLADLRDTRLLERAHEAARRVVKSDPRLLAPQHRALKDALLADYREPLEMALVG
ncbi:MAG: ATP-dependent DNA helicase RecG [Candidatus Eisenbacteria bacterium]|uniref:Probable DNA 3'-5' helicase RecG n=1 Tax=Eiseniibacteriota bacterium TaxID=2212470 RepID=A0A538U437_UNCEI|nr:MAG: ATP-dependent DNA helicase RecG [Candidatus Eisenbacteria bacterium]